MKLQKTAGVTSFRSREQILEKWRVVSVPKGTVHSRGVKAKKKEIN